MLHSAEELLKEENKLPQAISKKCNNQNESSTDPFQYLTQQNNTKKNELNFSRKNREEICLNLHLNHLIRTTETEIKNTCKVRLKSN